MTVVVPTTRSVADSRAIKRLSPAAILRAFLHDETSHVYRRTARDGHVWLLLALDRWLLIVPPTREADGRYKVTTWHVADPARYADYLRVAFLALELLADCDES